MSLPALEPFLATHPDPRFANYIRRGFQQGFRIGFSNPSSPLRDTSRNHPSAYQHTNTVSEHLATEIRAGRIIRADPPSPTHINPLGLVPKSGQPRKFRLIMDLSSPHDYSVNDGINPELCSLKYAAIDQAMLFIQIFGRGALLAKIDLQNAYRVVPVHPIDQPLLGLKWNGTIYRDTVLPFGLRSAPKIFTAVAEALAWAMVSIGVSSFLHYLDNFLFMGPATDSTTDTSLQLALSTCAQISFPVSHHKTVGPTHKLTFLGIEIDTIAGTKSLPVDKLHRLKELLSEWQDRTSAPKRDLLSLLDHLSHASTVIRPGRIFVCHLIEYAKQVNALHHYVRLNHHCRADLAWWKEFGLSWDGSSIWLPDPPTLSCFSDASGKWGCGTILSTSPNHGSNYNGPNPGQERILQQRTRPCSHCCRIMGTLLEGPKGTFLSDNTATVAAIQSGSAKDPSLRHLLRCFFFIAASWQFDYAASHIPGVENTAADALSQDRAHLLPNLVLSANNLPSFIPLSLQELLFSTETTWTSPHWRGLFTTYMDTVSLGIRHEHTTRQVADT